MGKHVWWALLGIVAVAALFRFLHLQSIPPGLWPDEAVNGLNALEALSTNDFKVFYKDNFGREGLFINLQALAISIFGAHAWVLRMVSAIVGTLTTAALFFAGRELFRNMHHPHMMALAASLLAAVSFWHVIFSRIGFRAILLPLLATLAVWLMLTALRKRSRFLFFGSGFFYGLSLSTYIASRFLPLLAVALFVYDAWRLKKTRQGFRALLVPWLWCAAGFTIAVLPLAGYFAQNPDGFFGRAGDVSIFATEQPLASLAYATVRTLAMFHVTGDGNWRHNIAHAPQLDIISGVLVLLGLFVALLVLRKHSSISGRRLCVIVIWLWLWLMLLPGILSSEGVPHSLRVLGAVPPLMLLAALGFGWLLERITKSLSAHWSKVAIAALAVLVAVINFYQYFFLWAPHPKVRDAFRNDLSDIALLLVAQPEEVQKIVVVNRPGVTLDQAFIELSPIRFLTYRGPEIHYLSLAEIDDIEPRFDQTVIVPLVPRDQELFASLRALFPSVERREEKGVEYYIL